MSKINLVLVGFIVLLAGVGIGYTMTMSGSHDEAYLKETAVMMKDDSVMMKEMSVMIMMNGKMMEDKGTQYNDMDLTAIGKTATEKATKLDEMSKEMVKRGEKMMEMIK